MDTKITKAFGLSGFVIFVFFVTFVVTASAAGKSDVADAAARGDIAAVRALIAQKADVNAPQADGATALHWAVFKSNKELADILLQALARIRRPPIAKAPLRCGSPASMATPR